MCKTTEAANEPMNGACLHGRPYTGQVVSHRTYLEKCDVYFEVCLYLVTLLRESFILF